ncbi:hypothetical protein MRB53_041007 [Persea americana]|nr:hypothetical protein MRB53_041007 [Persea americana]
MAAVARVFVRMPADVDRHVDVDMSSTPPPRALAPILGVILCRHASSSVSADYHAGISPKHRSPPSSRAPLNHIPSIALPTPRALFILIPPSATLHHPRRFDCHCCSSLLSCIKCVALAPLLPSRAARPPD